MAFRFSLAAVLKYREALEQRELAALERVQSEIAMLENQVRTAEEDLCRLEQRRDEDLLRGMPSVHLQDAIAQEHAVNHLKKELAQKREEQKARRQEILKAYEEAHQKHELLEKLRSRRFGQYTREQAKAEQATIDDLFLSRWNRSK
jgi:flagellar FliJ protein